MRKEKEEEREDKQRQQPRNINYHIRRGRKKMK